MKRIRISGKTRGLKHLILMLALMFLIPCTSGAGETPDGKTLLVYYSRTGLTKIVCDTLKQQIDAEVLEIKDMRDRSGRWGYYSAGFDSVLNRYTRIEPQNFDLAPYSSIIILSPVWNWKLSVPIRTFIHNNRFDGKKMFFMTTANNEVTKYESYGDDAPFMKRFFRNYLRGKCETMKAFVKESGVEVTGYYHVATLEKTKQEIIDRTNGYVEDIQKNLSSKPQVIENIINE